MGAEIDTWPRASALCITCAEGCTAILTIKSISRKMICVRYVAAEIFRRRWAIVGSIINDSLSTLILMFHFAQLITGRVLLAAADTELSIDQITLMPTGTEEFLSTA